MQESDLFGPKMAFQTDVSHYDVVESLLKCLTSSITIKQYRSIYRRDEARSEDNVLLEDFYWFEFTTLCYDFTRCKKIIERLV